MDSPGSAAAHRRPLWLEPGLRVVYAVTLMAVLGVVSVAPAFPRVARDLGLPPAAVGRLITAFTLPGIFLTPLLGILADRWGRRRILVPALVLFGLAGGLCSLAASFGTLLALRFVQGVGAAALGSLNVTLVGDLFTGRRRIAAMGYNATVLSLGTALYPLIGGGLATLGWRYPFALPFLALPVAALAIRALEAGAPQGREALGTYLGGLARRLADRRILALLGTSAVTFALLYGAYLTYFPFLLAERFAASPFVIGAVLSSSSAATAVTASQLGRIAGHLRRRRLIQGAFGLYALALGLVPLLPRLGHHLLPTLLMGTAMGINLPSLLSLLAGAVPEEQRAAFLSVNGTALRLGQTAGPLLAGLAFGAWGIAGPFFAGAAVALAMLAVLMAALR